MIYQQQCHNTTRDSCIGKVEDWGEEHTMLTRIDRHPIRHVPFYQGEVEHIDHLAIEELTVPFSPRLEICHLRIRGIVEDESVEKTINDVACRTRCNEGETNDVSRRSSTLDFAVDEPPNQTDSHHSEKREEEFAAPEFPSESHPVVLYKQQAEPAGDFDAFTQLHARLDTDLDDLVNDKNGHE